MSGRVKRHIAFVGVQLLALALFPTLASAHPGHSHGSNGLGGRIAGMPDYRNIQGVVTEFDPRTREYVERRPGVPPLRAHIETTEPPADGEEALGGYQPLPPYQVKPACATSGHRIVVVRSFDEGTGVTHEEDAHIRSVVGRMNWKFMQQSQRSSEGEKTLRMKVDCDASGAVTVTDVEVPYGYLGPGVNTTDGKIDLVDMRNYVEISLGEPEDAQAVKYLILYDRDMKGENFVGVGYRWNDADKTSSDTYVAQAVPSPEVNINRVRTTSAIISRNANHTVDGRDAWESVIPVHELLHVMNATVYTSESTPANWVQAPYANTGSHCIDGIDILCYESGASPDGKYGETRCPESAGYGTPEGVAIDCKFDTYFDAKTEPGEWLSQWWNTGGSENPFLVEGEDKATGLDSDVNGDGRSDLVTVDSGGTAHIFRGTASGFETASPTDSLADQVDPALHDGVGHYVIDTADVTGEGRADLVTIKGTGGVYVHKGLLDGNFASGVEALPNTVKPVMNGTGSFEPIAVGDVNADGYGDLVGRDGTTVVIYPGQANGTFGAKVTTSAGGEGALLDNSGFYSFEVADVSGDGRADLVEIYGGPSNEFLYVYKALSSGTGFGTIPSWVAIPTILDDGSGEEPVGLADYNADGRADLVTLEGTTLKLRTATAEASFGAATTAYAGTIDSSLLDGKGEELVGLLDYNSDGRADLVSAKDTGTVQVYAAQAGGTFAAPVAQSGTIASSRIDYGGQQFATEKPFLRRTNACTATGCKWPPAKAAADDVNGDGRSDLLTVDSGGTAHVFRGTASGFETASPTDSLADQVDPALYDGVGHYVIDTADVTGEGRADLVTIKGTGGVYVHPGRADRTFKPAIEALPNTVKPVMNGTGSFEPIAVGDVNADGYGDLVALDHADSGGRIVTYSGQANGTFAAGVSNLSVQDSALLDGVGGYPLDVIDVTGDGYADMVTMATNGVIGVRAGSAAGTFSGGGSASLNTILDDGSGEEPVGLSDLTGDGKADLVSLTGQTLKLRAAQSSGAIFGAATTAYAGTIDSSLLDGKGEELVGLLDYNSDGRADLVSAKDTGTVQVYAAQAGGTFAAPVAQSGTIASSRIDYGGQQFATEKPFLRRTNRCTATGCKWSQARAGQDDANGDGRSDLLTVDSGGTAHVFRGTASGFETASPIDSLTGQVDPALYDGVGHYVIDTADVTGDGEGDLVTIKGTGGVYVHRGRLDGTFKPAIEALPNTVKPVMNGTGSFEPIAVGDVNADGYGDLVGRDGTTVVIYPGQANGTFGAKVTTSAGGEGALLDNSGFYSFEVADVSDDGSGEEPVGLADYNADGRADLVTLEGTTLKLRTATAEASFGAATTAYAGTIDSSLLDGKGEELIGLLDYNQDGRADLVSAKDTGTVQVYAAQAGGTFAAPVAQSGTIASSRIDYGGQQFATEKPFLRRTNACTATGCKWPPGS